MQTSEFHKESNVTLDSFKQAVYRDHIVKTMTGGPLKATILSHLLEGMLLDEAYTITKVEEEKIRGYISRSQCKD